MKVMTNLEAKSLAKLYHKEETYKHVRRVAKYVQTDRMIPNNIQNDCITLAYLHDLCEDTEFADSNAYKTLHEPLKTALLLLTHDKENMSYDEYCKRIKDSVNTPAGKLAWFVKIADMKDHLNKTDTLTDGLKEKYLSGLRYLL